VVEQWTLGSGGVCSRQFQVCTRNTHALDAIARARRMEAEQTPRGRRRLGIGNA
jgi:hypothetical protein